MLNQLNPLLIEQENAYRRLLSTKDESFMTDEKLIDKENWKEHYVRKGDPSKPTYYILRRMWRLQGIFSNFASFAGGIRYALSKGWLPVIDMQNYYSAYIEPEKLGKENAWEYFFEQPLRIGLKQAYNGENIVLCKNDQMYPRMEDFVENGTALTKWRMIVELGLLRIKEDLYKEILATHAQLFKPNDRVLGVKLRGTDYNSLKPKGHNIQPTIEQALTTVTEKLKEWNFNKMFLAAEDKTIVDAFKKAFGDMCITYDCEYIDYKPGSWIVHNKIDRPNDSFLQAKDYITQMVLLSKCTSFIGSQCSGTIGAMMLAEKFEHTYIFNLGRY